MAYVTTARSVVRRCSYRAGRRASRLLLPALLPAALLAGLGLVVTAEGAAGAPAAPAPGRPVAAVADAAPAAAHNRRPKAPTDLAIMGDCYPGACASPAVVRTRQPILRATVTDPNGDVMRVRFEVRDASKSSVVASTRVRNVASGSSPTWETPTLPQDSQFHFRVRARDAFGWGRWSRYYTFYVDTLAPAEPTVSSADYPHKDTNQWQGGVGQPGSFTFSPNGAADVVAYESRINGGSVTTATVLPGASHTATITPTSDGEQVLEVRSIDHAGNASAWHAYAFYVNPQPIDVAYWKFDEGTGTTAATSPNQPEYAGVLHGGATWAASEIGLVDPGASGTAVVLDGTDDYVAMPRMLATDHEAGFSVSAWVRPDALTGYHTVAAQAGMNTYGFRLYHEPSVGWCFAVTHVDDLNGAATSACSSLTPQVGVWTHLAGVYDRPAGVIRLYVNGGPNVFDPEFGQGSLDEASVPLLWPADGSFTVGRRVGGPAEWWAGRIDEVRVFQRAVVESSVAQMVLSCRFGTCPEAEL